MTNVAIIILNWNQPELTLTAIDSILKIKHPHFNYKIILVDNGSSDNSLTIFTKKYQKLPLVKIISNNNNLGYVEGNNRGINYALKHNFNYLLIINNDVIVDPNFLKNLISFHQQNNNFALMSPKIYFAPGYEYHRDRYKTKDRGKVIWSFGGQMDWDNIYGSNIAIDQVDNGQFIKSPTYIDFLSGCCLFAPTSTFNQIGLFDKRYFMYLEDVDFCQRLIKQGKKLCVVPDSIIWHINAGSSTAGGGPLHDYFITRNRLLFGFTYARIRTKLALLKESLKIILSSHNFWKKKAVFDFMFNNFGKGSWQ